MRTKKCVSELSTAFLAALAIASGVAASAFGQEEEPKFLTRVYQLADMILPTPQHEYRGDELPTTNLRIGTAAGLSGSGGGGFGGGGLGGGGGGAFNVQEGQPAAAGGGGFGGFAPGGDTGSADGLTMHSLIATLHACVEPDGWDVTGGHGSMRSLGTMLIVTQTEAVHKKVQEFLNDLRTQGGALRTVTVAAWWLLLDSEQLARLQVEEAGRVRTDPAQLAKLAQAETSLRGQIACFSGQTVHIVSGKRKNVVTTVVPVVGNEVGYHPKNALPNVGALLQVRPTLLADASSAIVDIKSYVTETSGATETIEIQSSKESTAGSVVTDESPGRPGGAAIIARKPTQTTLRLDRVNLKTQALGTTIRTALAEPVLVGGLTDLPVRENDGPTGEIKPKEGTADGLATKKLVRRGERPQLYLVVQVNLNEERKAPARK